MQPMPVTFCYRTQKEGKIDFLDTSVTRRLLPYPSRRGWATRWLRWLLGWLVVQFLRGNSTFKKGTHHKKKETMARFFTKSTLLLLTIAKASSFSGLRTSFRPLSSMGKLYNSSPDTDSVDITTSSSLNHVNGIQALSTKYDTFLLDMWGVMHNGSEPYEGVIDTITQLKKSNKRMVILSNSSKRISNSKKMLKKLGFDEEDFAQIITSGEVSYRMLCGDETLQCSSWDILSDLIKNDKKKAFVFGSGDGDEEYITESGWSLASVEEADLIVARGTFTIDSGNGEPVSKKNDEEEYFRVLNESLSVAASRNLPMLVTNPDKVRPDKGLPPMPGAIGDSYESILGDDDNHLVKRIGKPFSEVYELARMGCEDDATVMIGDALETDVTGGTWARISTAWVVNDGIHSEAVREQGDFDIGIEKVLKQFNAKKGYEGEDHLSPTYVSKHFRW